MKRLWFGLMLPFALFRAWASNPVVPVAAADATINAKAELVRYHWRLQEATTRQGHRIKALFVRPDKPLQLDFDDKWYQVRNSCNYMSGRYSLVANLLAAYDGMETVVGCLLKMTTLDEAIGEALAYPLVFSLEGGDSPELTLTTISDDRLVFAGKLIGERLSIEVAAHPKPCKPASTTETQCLQVREVSYDESDGSYDADGPFENLDGDIDGFEREDGVRYVLDVERFAIGNPGASETRYRYVLEWTPLSDATGR